MSRYAQCDDTCTVDCGHCKGNGRPATFPVDHIAAAADALRPHAGMSVRTAERVAAALMPVVDAIANERAAEALIRHAQDLLDRQAKALVRASKHVADKDDDAWHRDIGRGSGYGIAANLAHVRAYALTTTPTEE